MKFTKVPVYFFIKIRMSLLISPRINSLTPHTIIISVTSCGNISKPVFEEVRELLNGFKRIQISSDHTEIDCKLIPNLPSKYTMSFEFVSVQERSKTIIENFQMHRYRFGEICVSAINTRSDYDSVIKFCSSQKTDVNKPLFSVVFCIVNPVIYDTILQLISPQAMCLISAAESTFYTQLKSEFFAFRTRLIDEMRKWINEEHDVCGFYLYILFLMIIGNI
jgi:hypothetical protein